MMHSIKQKIGTPISARTMHFASHDINSTLMRATKFAWFSVVGLFVGYLYFIGAITFSVVRQESLAEDIKTFTTALSREELRYLELQKRLTANYAIEQGFVQNSEIAYTIPASAFAWNIDVRQ